MNKNLQKFGEKLKKIRIEKGITLREASRLANYDPSNWSKIERGKMPPPSNEKILRKWAEVLGLNKEGIQEFVDEAKLVQGLLPQDIATEEDIINCLPAFYRTLRNKKPSRKEINKLIKLIKRV
ncbi:hypothetical protein AMJ47_02995 [Parcubacteria bacterium DG_72]|nr:MAG: hypothetical protein AMJ47_02995 [Parcubacteria bacterium DG_72]